jgi:hypothetical protein
MNSAAVSTHDGRVVIMGGTDPSTAATRSVQLAAARQLQLSGNSSANAWKNFEDMPTARSGLTAVALNDGETVLAIGGDTGSKKTPSGAVELQCCQEVEALNMSSGKWER